MIYYIGAFPLPVGGVTIKNKILFKNLSDKLEIKKIDVSLIKQKNIKVCILFLKALLGKDNTFIVGTSQKGSKIISCLLYIFNKKALKKSLMFVMGGTAHRKIISNKIYKKIAKEYKVIYVETNKMKKAMDSYSINNVERFPNCRERVNSLFKSKKNDKKFQCLFFSQISREKGMDIIIDTAKKMSRDSADVFFDIYGNIVEEYEDIFFEEISNLKNVSYKGVINGTNQEIVNLMVQYNVLLFPTLWNTEGVPGVLVEAKQSALPIIASDYSYNSEIIENEKNGIVLKNATSEDMKKAILQIKSDKNFEQELAQNSKESFEEYCIDSYIDAIVGKLR